MLANQQPNTTYLKAAVPPLRPLSNSVAKDLNAPEFSELPQAPFEHPNEYPVKTD